MKTIRELKIRELEKVTGGEVVLRRHITRIAIHKGCGGEVSGVNDPFSFCVCEKCGTRQYFASGFPGGIEMTTKDEITYVNV